MQDHVRGEVLEVGGHEIEHVRGHVTQEGRGPACQRKLHDLDERVVGAQSARINVE